MSDIDSPLNDIRIGKVSAQWAETHAVRVSYHASLESTNDLAKREAFTEPLLEDSLCIYLTDHQSQGRGRGTNTWSQPENGAALLSSWSYLISAKPQPTTSCLVGLALYRACVATWPFLPWNLKAPNDIYIGAKKIAGLLIENITQDDETRLVIGLGLNVISSPAQIATAGSIAQALPTGTPLLGQDWSAFLDRLLFELSDAVSHCEEELTSTDQASLLIALNAHPLLKEKYLAVEADGSLLTAGGKISWSEL